MGTKLPTQTSLLLFSQLYEMIDHDVRRIYQMLKPKPSELLQPRVGRPPRKLVREGKLMCFSDKDKINKPRYFFMFNDCLLLTKHEGINKYWLKVYVTWKKSIQVEAVKGSTYRYADVEFRVYAPKRTFILFASSTEERDAWVKDIEDCLTGRVDEKRSSTSSSSRSSKSSERERYSDKGGYRDDRYSDKDRDRYSDRTAGPPVAHVSPAAAPAAPTSASQRLNIDALYSQPPGAAYPSSMPTSSAPMPAVGMPMYPSYPMAPYPGMAHPGMAPSMMPAAMHPGMAPMHPGMHPGMHAGMAPMHPGMAHPGMAHPGMGQPAMPTHSAAASVPQPSSTGTTAAAPQKQDPFANIFG